MEFELQSTNEAREASLQVIALYVQIGVCCQELKEFIHSLPPQTVPELLMILNKFMHSGQELVVANKRLVAQIEAFAIEAREFKANAHLFDTSVPLNDLN